MLMVQICRHLRRVDQTHSSHGSGSEEHTLTHVCIYSRTAMEGLTAWDYFTKPE